MMGQSCPHCGFSNDSGARYCGECGRQLAISEVQIESNGGSEGRSGSRWLLLGCGLALALLCGGCALVLLLSSQFEPDNQVDEFGGNVPTETAAAYTGFYDVWLEHNVSFEDQNYLVAHLEFEVEQARADQVLVTGLIWQADGSAHEGLEPEYTVDGQAGVMDFGQVEFSPSTYWEDYQFWIPYYALYVGEDYTMTLTLEAVDSNTLLDSWQTETFDVE